MAYNNFESSVYINNGCNIRNLTQKIARNSEDLIGKKLLRNIEIPKILEL